MVLFFRTIFFFLALFYFQVAQALPPCLMAQANILLSPPNPKTPLNVFLSEESAMELLFGKIDGQKSIKNLVSRIKELSVAVPGQNQARRIEIYEYFAKLYQDKMAAHEQRESNLHSKPSLVYRKHTSESGIVYFVAGYGEVTLLYMPDGKVYSGRFDLTKLILFPKFDFSELPTSIDDPKFKDIYEVKARDF